MRDSRLRVLVLHAQYTTRLSYYDDWLDTFRDAPEFATTAVNIVPRGAAAEVRKGLAEVDAVVLLHSTNGDTTVYLEPLAATLAARTVPLLTFVGNEVNLPGSPIADKRRVLALFRPDFIATQLLHEAGEYLWGDLAARRVVAIPHGLNPAAFRPERAASDRPIDIGARLVKYLPHLGDEDRNRLMDHFTALGREGRLNVDISDERYDRPGWADFLNRCKGTVSTEAGSWYIERDDATVNAIRARVLADAPGFVIANDSPLRRLGHKLPWWMRAVLRRVLRAGPLRHEALVNEGLSHEEILSTFFAGKPRAPVYGKCISSRNFDAIGTKTVQIMFRGRFNDILEADRHYIALDDDFANLEDALARFADPTERAAIADEAHALVMSRHTYAHRMTELHDILTAA